MLRVIKYSGGPLDNNTYLIVDDETQQAAIVDPSFDTKRIWPEIGRMELTLTHVLCTHAHIDHVVENAYFVEQSGAPLWLHPDDLGLLRAMPEQAAWMGMEPPAPCRPSSLFSDNQEIAIGNGTIKVVHTPGHSPGSVSLIGDGWVISGDALFAGSIGRTDLPGGSYNTLIQAIKTRLLTLSDNTVVHPGHGQDTTIGAERRVNMYLQEYDAAKA